MNPVDIKKKLVIVGDDGVGKTCLLMVHVNGAFPKDSIPTVFDNYTCKIQVKNQQLLLQLWDTPGQEEFDVIRPYSYPGTDMVLLCFSVASRESFMNAQTKWREELRQHCPKAEIVLVGTKCDLRETSPSECIKIEECKEAMRKTGAVAYKECSALKNTGVREAFEEAIVQMTDEGKKCVIL
eukprot:MONOS_16771.1-p1 / transcript=MONOS_16771.1 / gene=MONOS_16771 / organism=Monocercomonoides_exilis_PA203 / gene_product=Rac1b, Rho family GTPase / transcript_product=Rac1b, Rho family GTPase / location=Mono_scaffold00006:31187-32133(-) / protein_length=182 / sequence_SO=supercontig / SO=protein_coding / is_pseudo=false